jgi:hypothetical protein
MLTRTSDKEASGTIDITGPCGTATSMAVCSYHLLVPVVIACCFPYAGPVSPPGRVPSPIYLH